MEQVEGKVVDQAVVALKEGEVYVGRVKWFDPAKGYGFLVADQGEVEVFVHQSEIKSEQLNRLYEDMRVSFTFTEKDGKKKATVVQGEDGKPLEGHLSHMVFAQRLKDNPEIQTGTIKWFDQTKGFGFILPTDGSEDVFVHESETKSSFRGQTLDEGTQVEFQVKIEPKKDGSGDSIKAHSVTAPGGGLLPPSNATTLAGLQSRTLIPNYSIMPVRAPQAAPLAHYAPPLATGNPRQVGTVKWFDTTKGFGFIVPGASNTELFVHKSKIRAVDPANPVLRQDQQVEFSVEQVPGKNACAIDVTLPGGMPVGGQPAYAAHSAVSPLALYGKRKPAYDLGPPTPFKSSRHGPAPAAVYGAAQMAAPLFAPTPPSHQHLQHHQQPTNANAAYSSTLYGSSSPAAPVNYSQQPMGATQLPSFGAFNASGLPAYSPSLYPY